MRHRIHLTAPLLLEAVQISLFLRGAADPALRFPCLAAAAGCAAAFAAGVFGSLRRGPFEGAAAYWIAKLATALSLLAFANRPGFGFAPFAVLGLGTGAAVLSFSIAGLVRLSERLRSRFPSPPRAG